MLLFLYGTLLDPSLVTRLTGRTVALRPATLAGWRRVRLRGTPYPTLLRAPGQVYGALLQADRAMFRTLLAYEGRRYRLMAVRPCSDRGVVTGYAWIAKGATLQPWP